MRVAVNKTDWFAIIVILLLLTATKKELVDILTLFLQK